MTGMRGRNGRQEAPEVDGDFRDPYDRVRFPYYKPKRYGKLTGVARNGCYAQKEWPVALESGVEVFQRFSRYEIRRVFPSVHLYRTIVRGEPGLTVRAAKCTTHIPVVVRVRVDEDRARVLP